MRTIPYAGVVVAMFIAGIFICGQTASDVGAIDPGSIVYDEIVGFLVAMYLLPRDWRCLALLLFYFQWVANSNSSAGSIMISGTYCSILPGFNQACPFAMSCSCRVMKA